tara:strand:+ start:830 stop:1264 length:435 start_codon:yes stop_codon:yes gene_type:complete
MATIRLSTTMKKMWRNAFANYTSSNTTNGEYNQLFNWGGVIRIYSGTINDLGASTQLLSVTDAFTTVETDGNNENIIYSGQVSANASGTASWFSLSTAFDINPYAYGTVGTDGSGADLMIGNTAIVSGETYFVNGLRLKFSNAI